MDLKTILEVIQGGSIILASITAIYGISSWRREAKWKRKYEIAEEVLTTFYEISDKFERIRSPHSYVGEGKTRKRNEQETKEESEILDKAYIVFERFEKEKDPFIKLRSIKYRFMVLYGKESVEPFMEIEKLTSKLLFASKQLGQRYWKEQGRKEFTEKQLEKHLAKMEELENIFWSDDEMDPFKNEINATITKIEEICGDILGKNSSI